MPKDNKPIMGTFIVFSVILFLVILVVGSISFAFSMQQIVKTNKGNELAQLLETERIRLESIVNAEIALTLKLSNSPIIKRYLLNPADPESEEIAMDEIASYRRAFKDETIFWISDTDRIFYFDDFEPYWLDAEDPVNYWYYMTLYETEVYNFNINYNPDLDQIRLWVNAPVLDNYGIPVGIVGTGLELSDFIDSVYGNIGEWTELYFFIADGKIYGARDVQLIIDGAGIEDVLNKTGIDILAETGTLEPWEKRSFATANGIVAIGFIPLLDWYYIAVMTYSIADYDTAMTALFLVVLALILLIIIIFNVFISGFLKSLRKASESLMMISKVKEQTLVADNEMLDRLNRMKNEFFQNMNHEFKTPLNVISTSVFNVIDMCDFELDKNIIREVLGNAQSETMRMARMVDSAMKYTHLHDNRQGMKVLDIVPLLSEGAETYRALLERQGNALYLDIPEALPPILGNTDMLLHVLSNLLSNANKHTRNGEIRIKAAEQDGMIIIVIRDNGIGIKPELLPNIFERGVSEGGTGLGLSICMNAVTSHGGNISIESDYGHGTEITINLPVYVKPDGEVHENET